MKQLTGHDASFIYLENASQPMHVGSIMIYDPSTAPGGTVRFKQILQHIDERLHVADLFRKRLQRVPGSLDHPWWVDDPDFDIEYHVRHIALPAPGDWRQLCIQAARVHARPLDTSRPLWEFTVIEGLGKIDGLPPGCYAVVSKVHHACIDGVSGDALNAALHDLEPEPAETAAPEPWKPRPAPTSGELVARAVIRNTVEPLRFARLVGRTVPAVGRAISTMNKMTARPVTPGQAPRTRFNGTISAHRVFDSVELDLATVRQIRAAVPGSTVNDVVLSIVGGAMRTYLESVGELPDETLTAMAPISVRSAGDEGSDSNRVSAMFVPLATDVGDPVERLERVHRGTQASKTMTDAVGASLLADYAQFTPAMFTSLGARLASRLSLANRTNPPYNTVVSNVPGPQVPLYMNGAKLVAMHGLAPIHDAMGLFHGVYSYCGTIALSVTACREMLPDPDVYAAGIRQAYEDLCAACH